METAKGKAREEITRVADRVDSFENYNYPHSRLVAELATRLARRLGLTSQDTHAITEAALLHDIGLETMKPAYHSTTGLLSYEERMDLWRHAVIGEQQMAKRDASRHAQLLVRWHHEWWNGLGYPDMLAFEDIPIGARVLRAVELYSALIGDRPYRAAMNGEQAMETLKAAAGIECDPYVVKALAALLDDIRAQYEWHEPPRSQAAAEQPESPPAAPPAPTPTPAPLTGDAWPLELPDEFVNPSIPAGAVESSAGFAAIDAPLEDALLESALPREDKPENISGTSDHLVDAGTLRVTPTPPARGPVESPADAPASETIGVPSPPEWLMVRGRLREMTDAEDSRWPGWRSSGYNRKSLLGFEASVLRQIEFRSVAIPFCGWTRLDLYLKAWGRLILANDPRCWAATVARATLESHSPLSEEQIAHVLEDVYVPGARLTNPELRRWFGETDAWWMDNLRRNIESLEEEGAKAQALAIGLMTGDYALSFSEETLEFRRPLTTVFWRLAGRALAGPSGYASSRSSNLAAEAFIRQARADLLYLNVPSAHTARGGAEARSEWKEAWVRNPAVNGGDDLTRLTTAPQSKRAYLAMIDASMRAGAHIRTWAIAYQEIGMASAAEITELIQEHRPVRATYSKDLTEVVGGLRNHIIVAERANGR